MRDAVVTNQGAVFIDAPRDPALQALHAYWLGKCGDRSMPAREDIDPGEMRPLLPSVILYDMVPPLRHRVRLVGQDIVDFVGRNYTGEDVTSGMPADAAQAMRAILDTVAETGSPRFRSGKAYWLKKAEYRHFEACFLPLSRVGEPVNIILGGVRFDL